MKNNCKHSDRYEKRGEKKCYVNLKITNVRQISVLLLFQYVDCVYEIS